MSSFNIKIIANYSSRVLFKHIWKLGPIKWCALTKSRATMTTGYLSCHNVTSTQKLYFYWIEKPTQRSHSITQRAIKQCCGTTGHSNHTDLIKRSCGANQTKYCLCVTCFLFVLMLATFYAVTNITTNHQIQNAHCYKYDGKTKQNEQQYCCYGDIATLHYSRPMHTHTVYWCAHVLSPLSPP